MSTLNLMPPPTLRLLHGPLPAFAEQLLEASLTVVLTLTSAMLPPWPSGSSWGLILSGLRGNSDGHTSVLT